ncbi:YkvA family protein [Marinibaculum pumilum]|uniref:YkvA family protein n=1 Tax=Marinibaculum pumilum TaxID=1766165 RepID=A0ABV7KY90_9PROT
MSESTATATGLDPAAEEALVRDGFWRKLRRTAGHVPFAEDAAAAFYSATDRATPLTVKATLFGALAYFVLPTDAVADFLPLIGYGDDLAVLLAATRAVGGSIRDSHRAAARRFLQKD